MQVVQEAEAIYNKSDLETTLAWLRSKFSETATLRKPGLQHIQAADAAIEIMTIENCVICNSTSTVGCKLECGHTLHQNCMEEWCRVCGQCPTCGLAVRSLLEKQNEEYAVAVARDSNTIDEQLTRRKRLQRFENKTA